MDRQARTPDRILKWAIFWAIAGAILGILLPHVKYGFIRAELSSIIFGACAGAVCGTVGAVLTTAGKRPGRRGDAESSGGRRD